jgi:hypothetical protein
VTGRAAVRRAQWPAADDPALRVTDRLLGWPDSTHVSVVRGPGDESREGAAVLDVDVTTGSAEQRFSLPADATTGLVLAGAVVAARAWMRRVHP